MTGTSNKLRYLRLAVMPLALMSLSSCAGMIAGVGATIGTAAVQEGGLSRAASDARIQADINERWFSHNVNMFAKLDMTVNQGRVLVTGVVQDPDHRVQAVYPPPPSTLQQWASVAWGARGDGCCGRVAGQSSPPV